MRTVTLFHKEGARAQGLMYEDDVTALVKKWSQWKNGGPDEMITLGAKSPETFILLPTPKKGETSTHWLYLSDIIMIRDHDVIPELKGYVPL